LEEKSIHIVSFDVPYPPDYGGVIDVYFKCKSLKEIGMHVILHCFEYGRGRPEQLQEIADQVYYYPRKKSLFSFFSSLPFIVQTRNNPALLENLLKDDAPVLFEGLHCCYFLQHPKLKSRCKLVRAHNVESEYYSGLAGVENNFLKKLYFKTEARKLKNFEPTLKNADEILAITRQDQVYFQKQYHKGVYLPVFASMNVENKKREPGNYALYHGNLSVAENEFAVRFLVNEVWENDFPLKLIVAGKNPSPEFVKFLNAQKFEIQCLSNLSNQELNQLIRNAKINLLPAFQNTGIKLKLLNCLSNAGFCIANSMMTDGTGLEKYCFMAENASEWKAQIKKLALQPENEEALKFQHAAIRKMFDGQQNARKILEIIQQKNQSNLKSKLAD